MSRHIVIKPNKTIILLLSCQLLILCMALGSYLLSRGRAFSRSFTCDDLSFSAGVLQNDTIRINDTISTGETFITVDQPLEKGVYQVLINYVTNAEGSTISASAASLNGMEFRSTPAQLSPYMQTAELTVDLAKDTPQLTISVNYGGQGSLEVSALGIYESSNLYRRNVVYALAACAVLTLVYFFYKAEPAKRRIIFGLSTIFIASCYPLFVDFMIVGHDLPFHLLRIEGIYNGLLQGSFPVKIHPVWAQDHGYAVGVFYGDLALYFPALLRIMGFSIQAAYQWFVGACNLGTVLIAYFCFRKMFRSEKLGLWGSLLYTFSAYRLADVYTRAACGEYVALMFLPMVLCGFYLVFTTTPETLEKKWRKYSILIAFGLTGVIQSHILSCEMVALFILIACIVMVKKVCTRRVFLPLISAAALTILLNVGFLVPFLDYFNDSISINSDQWMADSLFTMQDKGMFLTQLLALFPRANGGTWQTAAGINTEVTYSIGFPLVICLGLFLYAALCLPKDKLRSLAGFKSACLCSALGILALFMSTCHFPWDALASMNPVFDKVVNTLQFPWRFLSVATVLLVYTACYVISVLPDLFEESVRRFFPIALATILTVSCGWYYYDFAFTGSPYRVYDTYELNSMAMYSCEYLPTGTDPTRIQYGKVITGAGLELQNYRKNGTTVYLQVSTSADSYIELPLNYYEYYICRDMDTKADYSVEAGTNNMVKVLLPADYEGVLQVSFREPAAWRISEILSLLSALAAGAFLLHDSRILNRK